MSSQCADPTDQCPHAKGTLGQHRAQGERHRKVKGQGDASTSQRTPSLREAPSREGGRGRPSPRPRTVSRHFWLQNCSPSKQRLESGFDLESAFN